MSGDGISQPPRAASIPPGWYADPAGGNGKRWWDGSRWTENVRVQEEPAPAPDIGNYAPNAGAYRSEFRPTGPLSTAEVGIAYTRTSWWLAGSPLWTRPAGDRVRHHRLAGAAPRADTRHHSGDREPPRRAALLGMAFADRAALGNGGNDSAASPWWTLLTPLAYLIARARHVRLYATGGWASVVWWIIAAILAPGVAVLGYFAVLGLLPV